MGVSMMYSYNVANGVKAFSTTRRGGVSTGKYGEFNINEYCGDEMNCIVRNRKLLAAELGIAPDHILLPHQVHGVEVGRISEDYFALPDTERKLLLEGIDAVMTDLKGVCVGVSTADCIPILLYDEAHHAAAAIHAGWRGTVKRIVQKTIEEMRTAYHTKTSELKAVIGPGISRVAFEVGSEVYDAFLQAGFDMETITELRPAMTAATDGQPQMKWHIDLPLCNMLQLLQAGLSAGNILQTGICTYSHCDDYFSARRLGIQSGRIYTGILLNQ